MPIIKFKYSKPIQYSYDYDVSIVYEREFNINYISVDRKIEVSELELREIIRSNRILLCDIEYEIIDKKIEVGSDYNSWILNIRNIKDISTEEEYLPF